MLLGQEIVSVGGSMVEFVFLDVMCHLLVQPVTLKGSNSFFGWRQNIISCLLFYEEMVAGCDNPLRHDIMSLTQELDLQGTLSLLRY